MVPSLHVTSRTVRNFSSILASSTVSQGFRRQGDNSSEPSLMVRPPWKNRSTKKVLGPRVSSMAETLRLIPVMAEAIAMTTMTPMATPRIVSAARTLLARSESSAMDTPSKIRPMFMAPPLFRAQRDDGIEP